MVTGAGGRWSATYLYVADLNAVCASPRIHLLQVTKYDVAFTTLDESTWRYTHYATGAMETRLFIFLYVGLAGLQLMDYLFIVHVWRLVWRYCCGWIT